MPLQSASSPIAASAPSAAESQGSPRITRAKKTLRVTRWKLRPSTVQLPARDAVLAPGSSSNAPILVLARGVRRPAVGAGFLIKPSAGVPAGALGVVTKVERRGGRVVVHLRPASLSRVFSSLQIKASGSLADARLTSPHAAADAEAHAALGPFAPQFSCTGSAPSPHINVDLSSMRYAIDIHVPDYIQVFIGGQPQFSLGMQFPAASTCSASLTASIPLGSTGLFVEVGPQFSVTAGGEVGANFAWAPKLTYAFFRSSTGSGNYDIHTLTSPSSSGITFSGSASVSAGLALKVGLTAFGRTGVEGTVGPSLTARTAVSDGQVCRVVDGTADADLDAYAHLWFDWTFDLAHLTFWRQELSRQCSAQPFSGCDTGAYTPITLSGSDLAASWPDYGNGTANQYFAPNASVFADGHSPAAGWQACVGRRTDLGSPTVSGGSVYVTDVTHDSASHLFAYDEASGNARWSKTLTVRGPYGNCGIPTPVVASGLVIVGSVTGVYAYNAQNGSQVWRYSSGFDANGSGCYSLPVASGGLVYVLSQDGGALIALNLQTGGVVWTAASWGTPKEGTQPMAVANGQVIIGNCAGGLAAYNAATGDREWATQIAAAPALVGPPLVVGQQVFVSAGGKLVALNATNGAIEWSLNVNASLHLVFSSGRLITTIGDGSTVALSPATGQTLWRLNRSLNGFAAIGSTVVGFTVNEPSQQLVAYDATSGAFRWSQTLAQSVTNSATIAAGSVMLTTASLPYSAVLVAWH